MKSMPDYIQAALTDEIKAELEQDAHCLGFPSKSTLQLRVSRNGNAFKKSFAYSQHGGHLKTIKTAMAKCLEYRSLSKPAFGHNRNHKDYVHYHERFSKSKGKTEYYYQVNYSVAGKQRSKTFGFGYNKPSAFKQLHGFLTAKLFRFYFDEVGDDIVKYHPLFKKWKDRQLYRTGITWFDWSMD